MKTIGIIGGMSWESTLSYYQIINETVQEALGGLHSAKIILYSVDFDEIERLQSNHQWDECTKILSNVAQKLEKAGAQYIVIATNTIHKIADEIQKSITIPILHIVEVIGQALKKNQIFKVGLLGTKYTMMEDFYKDKLIEAGIDVFIPNHEQIEDIHSIIFNELCHGIINEDSKQRYLNIIESLKQKGANGIVLGCTEIGLLIKQEDIALPLFDSTLIHARSAALLAIE